MSKISEVFSAALSLKDNVSGVLKAAKRNSSEYRREVERAKERLKELDRQKVREKELRIQNSAAYRKIEALKNRLKPLQRHVINVQARTEHALEKIKPVTERLKKLKNKTVAITVKGAKVAADAFGKVATSAGKVATTAVIGGTAAALTAVSVAGVSAVKQAVAFESQMKNVGTLLDGDVNAKLQDMGGSLKQVSTNTGIATADLTDGLYQTISAFGESADSVKQLEIAAKAAKAGNATTADAVNMLSAVTKGYGDTSAEAVEKVSDLAFETVKLGQTSFSELASSMGSVVPLASTMKVSQEELFGAMATLTGVTGGTAEVTTQLRATMQEFLSPSDGMQKALKKVGYASGAAALESDSLGTVLNKLKDYVKGDQVAFANLFSSVESKNAVLALTGAQAENFANKTAAMSKASGAAQKAYDMQASSVEALAGRIKNSATVMLTSLGEKTLPYIASALEAVSNKMPVVANAFDVLGGMIGPVIDGVMQSVGELMPYLKTVAGNVSTAFRGFNLHIDVKGLVKQIGPVLASVTDMIKNAMPTIQSAMAGVGTIFQSAVQTVIPAVMQISGTVVPIIGQVISIFNEMSPYIGNALGTVATVIASAVGVIAPIVSGIGTLFSAIMPVAAQIIQDAGNKINTVFAIIAEKTGGLQGVIASAAPVISSVLSTAWNVISPILDLAISAFDLLLTTVNRVFPVVQNIITSVWSVIGPVVEKIGKAVGTVANALSGLVGDVSHAISGSGVKADQNATGTSYFQGGLSVVGEHGPELISMPSGSKVFSNQTSKSMLSDVSTAVQTPFIGLSDTKQSDGKQILITIQNMEVRDASDIDKIAAKIIEKIEEADDNM